MQKSPLREQPVDQKAAQHHSACERRAGTKKGPEERDAMGYPPTGPATRPGSQYMKGNGGEQGYGAQKATREGAKRLRGRLRACAHARFFKADADYCARNCTVTVRCMVVGSPLSIAGEYFH